MAAPSLSARKPISVWNRPVQADKKGLFGALLKSALYGGTLQWTEAGASLADAAGALGLTGKEPEEVAWVLLRRALHAAMLDLYREVSPGLGKEIDQEAAETIAAELDAALEAEEVAIDRALFDRPSALPLAERLQEPFARWLVAFAVEDAKARAAAARLPSYFVTALHAEWRRDSTAYQPLVEAVKSPFFQAAERERAWALYASELDRQLDAPMFGEAFGLRQVYVPLRGYFFEEEEAKEDARTRLDSEAQARSRKRIAVDLQTALTEWLERGGKEDAYRVLSGGPGSGKSTLAKVFAAWVATASLDGRLRSAWRVLFIPLHQLDLRRSIGEAVGAYVRTGKLLLHNPLDHEEGDDRLLLVLDGLDELELQGRLVAEVARDFLREVSREIERRNRDGHRHLLALVTGREPAVQASQSELRDQRRILHVLPYAVAFPPGDKSWKAGKNLLDEDQRGLWWQRYGMASGRGYSQLPPELARPDLVEITAQPLLNYLVALSFDRQTIDFSQEVNLNQIYGDLLGAVYQRAYEDGRQHMAVRGLKFADFQRLLEEIALAAWHGNGRTTTVEEIKARCEKAGLLPMLKEFARVAEEGVVRVLTAFYFRQAGHSTAGEKTFEFTHKSFREYLTALRLVRAVERMDKGLQQREESYDEGWDERQALYHWAEIAGQTAVDLDLFQFLVPEVGLRSQDDALRWQRILARLISAMLRIGMPMERLVPRPSFREENRMARNAEEALLAALNACARATREVSTIDWPIGEDSTDLGTTSAGAWITRLRGQRSRSENGLALHCLSLLDLSRCALYLIDLFRAHLTSTVMSYAHAKFAILNFAQLAHAKLDHADLSSARLTNTNLTHADLTYSDLANANLIHADLTNADLTNANLISADLTNADLTNAVLTNADLTGANVDGANLDGAKFRSREALARTHGEFGGKPIFIEELGNIHAASQQPAVKRGPSTKTRDSRRQ
jgi:uncharacterized protein YjbI with pentapeptide repeats